MYYLKDDLAYFIKMIFLLMFCVVSYESLLGSKITREKKYFSRRNENISRRNEKFSRTNEKHSRNNENISRSNEKLSRIKISRTNEKKFS